MNPILLIPYIHIVIYLIFNANSVKIVHRNVRINAGIFPFFFFTMLNCNLLSSIVFLTSDLCVLYFSPFFSYMEDKIQNPVYICIF